MLHSTHKNVIGILCSFEKKIQKQILFNQSEWGLYGKNGEVCHSSTFHNLRKIGKLWRHFFQICNQKRSYEASKYFLCNEIVLWYWVCANACLRSLHLTPVCLYVCIERHRLCLLFSESCDEGGGLRLEESLMLWADARMSPSECLRIYYCQRPPHACASLSLGASLPWTRRGGGGTGREGRISRETKDSL